MVFPTRFDRLVSNEDLPIVAIQLLNFRRATGTLNKSVDSGRGKGEV